jgi:hypothetical protein
MGFYRSTFFAAALVAAAALPVAAQNAAGQELQQLAQQHADWHRRNDALRYRNPAEYEREHAQERQELDQQYQLWQRQVGVYQRIGYNQYPSQYPQQAGWYDGNGNWHADVQQQNGWYDQSGSWHANASQGSVQDRDDVRGGPKARGRQDNGKHKGWDKKDRAQDDQRGNDRDDH